MGTTIVTPGVSVKVWKVETTANLAKYIEVASSVTDSSGHYDVINIPLGT